MAISRSAMREKLRAKMDNNSSEENKKNDENNPFEPYLRENKNAPVFSPMRSIKDVGDTWEIFFDIIPHVIGDNYPTQSSPGLESPPISGEPYYYLKLAVHKNVGPDKKRVVCPSFNYGLDCPYCEEYKRKMEAAGDDKDEKDRIYNQMGIMWRSIYYIRLNEIKVNDNKYNEGEYTQGKIYTFDFPHAWMERELDKMKKQRDGTVCYYADPDEGKEIGFYLEKKEDKKYKPSGYSFYDRQNAISDDDMFNLEPLDSFIVLHDYDKIQAMMDGEDSEPKEQEDSSKPREEKNERKPVSSGGCQHNYNFGEDCNGFEECDFCDDYEDCLKEKRAISRKKREQSGGGTQRKRPQNMGDDVPF